MKEMDKQEGLRALLNPADIKSGDADAIVFLPDENDDSAQTDLKRKVVSLGKNVLRILDSGNAINKTGISKKVNRYVTQVEADLTDDPDQSHYIDLLSEINDVI